MVALSRLKATFEACFGLFRQSMHENIGFRLAKEWHAETAPPREAHRVTSKDVRATLSGCTTWRSDCGKCTSEDHLSQHYACRQSGPEAGRKQGFWEVAVAWAKAYGQARGYTCTVRDAIHMFLHKFTERWPCGYSASIQIRSPPDVPCHCSFTQPNTCIHSLAATAACRHSPSYMRTVHQCHGWPVPRATSLPCLCRRYFIQNWQHGQESRVGWRQNEESAILGRCSEACSSHPAFVCGCWVFSLLQAAFQVSSRLHSSWFMWKPAWWCTTIISETIKCWCVRVNCI